MNTPAQQKLHDAWEEHVRCEFAAKSVDETMATTFVSPQIEALLGVTPKEYIDDPDLWNKRLHPDDREQAMLTYLQGRESGAPFTFEYRLLASDGTPVWFRDSAVVVAVETGENRDADGQPLEVSIRATNVFRKEHGTWKMIGHHTDLLPFLQP